MYALSGMLAVASCTSPNPTLYTLAPVSGHVVTNAPKVVALHGVGVARYLQRSQIVKSSDDYRIAVRGNDWWGEPLEAMVSRVMVEDLSQRLPQATVYMTSSSVTDTPNATIELEIQRLDLDRAGNLLLIAQGSVSFSQRAATETRRFRISKPVPSPQLTLSQVAATSDALGEVADGLVEMLTAKAPRR